MQAVHHAPAHLGLVERGGEFCAQPQQSGLPPGLGALALGDLLLELGIGFCQSSGSVWRGQFMP